MQEDISTSIYDLVEIIKICFQEDIVDENSINILINSLHLDG